MTTESHDDHGGRPLLGLGLGEGLERAGSEARCWCRACNRSRTDAAGYPYLATTFVVCPSCGDKRCVHASDHNAPCAKDDIYAHNAWVERRHFASMPRPVVPNPPTAAVNPYPGGTRVYCCYAAFVEAGHDDDCPKRAL